MKLIILIAAMLAALLVAGFYDGNIASANTNHDATLAVAPAAPAVGDALAFSGCGYSAGEGVTVVVTSPYAYSWFGATADAAGCFDTTATETYTALEAGSYTAEAYQSNDHHEDAALTFAVS